MTLLLLTAPAAMMLQSCTYHDKIVINERHEIVIGVASAGTKGIIDNEDGSERLANMVKQCFNGNGTLKDDAGFGVFGFKKVIETSSLLFDNQLVQPDPASYATNAAHPEYTDWVYSPLRFWDLTASYQFIGYWPYSAATSGSGFYVTSSAPDSPTPIEDAHKQIILHNVPNWQLVDGDENDIMTATKVGRYNPDFSYVGSVRMSFRHVLSQLVVKAYYIGTYIPIDKTVTPNTGGVEIQGITLGVSDPITVTNEQTNEQSTVTVQVLNGGIIASSETTTDFKQRYDDDNPIALTNENGDNTNTIDLVDSYTLPWNSSDTNVKIAFKDETDPNAIVDTVVNRWLMVPHRWQKLKMTVDYQVGANTACTSEPVEVTLGAEFDDYKTLPGKRYVITLLLNTSNGSVTVADVAVERWTTHEIERTFYNW